LIPRLVREEDWALTREARLRALADSPDAFRSKVADESGFDEAVWRRRAAPSKRQVWFAVEKDGRFVGVVRIAFAEPDPGLASLFSMWVEPESRRVGIGRLLVEAAVGWAADRGAHSVELEVNEAVTSARGLYEACGFVPTGRTRLLSADERTTAIQMVRDIYG
jgi:ribosomal protein S18 acetylase RimI-like enzyme